jgi:hypothetical protein
MRNSERFFLLVVPSRGIIAMAFSNSTRNGGTKLNFIKRSASIVDFLLPKQYSSTYILCSPACGSRWTTFCDHHY